MHIICFQDPLTEVCNYHPSRRYKPNLNCELKNSEVYVKAHCDGMRSCQVRKRTKFRQSLSTGGTNLLKAEEPTEREAEEIRNFSAAENTKIAPVFCQARLYLNDIPDELWKGLCYVRN